MSSTQTVSLCLGSPPGFGPVAGVLWDDYDGKFTQPYNKREKIGRVCDFVGQAAQSQAKPAGKPVVAAVAKEIFDEDEKGFEVIEEETVLKKKQKTAPAQ